MRVDEVADVNDVVLEFLSIGDAVRLRWVSTEFRAAFMRRCRTKIATLWNWLPDERVWMAGSFSFADWTLTLVGYGTCSERFFPTERCMWAAVTSIEGAATEADLEGPVWEAFRHVAGPNIILIAVTPQHLGVHHDIARNCPAALTVEVGSAWNGDASRLEQMAFFVRVRRDICTDGVTSRHKAMLWAQCRNLVRAWIAPSSFAPPVIDAQPACVMAVEQIPTAPPEPCTPLVAEATLDVRHLPEDSTVILSSLRAALDRHGVCVLREHRAFAHPSMPQPVYGGHNIPLWIRELQCPAMTRTVVEPPHLQPVWCPAGALAAFLVWDDQMADGGCQVGVQVCSSVDVTAAAEQEADWATTPLLNSLRRDAAARGVPTTVTLHLASPFQDRHVSVTLPHDSWYHQYRGSTEWWVRYEADGESSFQTFTVGMGDTVFFGAGARCTSICSSAICGVSLQVSGPGLVAGSSTH